jgi:hypothetical protein
VVWVRAEAEADTFPSACFHVTMVFMAKTTLVTKKKRGPPATGQGIQIGERWHPPEVAAIDAWIKSQGGNLTRGHAIRRLVALGLKAKK